MSDILDPFSEPLPRRDRYDRPLLVPPNGGEPIPYQRMSTLSGMICGDFGLSTYKMRLAARGMGLREDLCAMAAALPPIHDTYCDAKTLSKEQRRSDADTKKKLDEYIEAAMETAGANYKANSGTAIHGFIEQGSALDAPQRMQADVQACLDLFDTHGVEVLASEVFVVNDELGAAGSFDHLVRWPTYGVVIADVKGLPLDTPIPTPTGWTAMSGLRVGDRVIGSDGKPCTVTTKSSTHHKPCVRVEFSDATSQVCDIDHRWAVKVGRGRQSEDDVMTAGDMQVQLKELLAGQHIRVMTPAPMNLPEIDLPLDPWALGAWLGDGKHTSGEVSKGDTWLFEEFARAGFPPGPDYSRNIEVNCETHTVQGLRTRLREMGLLGNKHIPAAYLRASYGQRLALLQGLMDTDGSWNIARNQASFIQVDHALAYQVHELALSLGQRAKIFDHKYSGFGVEGIAKAVNFTPIDLNPFRMPRKRDQVRVQAPVQSRSRIVTDVVDTLMVPTQCIEVDSADHTYLCGRDMIPTHNTGKVDGKGLQFSVQLSGYANALVYDLETDTRAPLESLTGGERVNRAAGVVLHVPLGAGKAEPYVVNLGTGLHAARLATQVRKARQLTDLMAPLLMAQQEVA